MFENASSVSVSIVCKSPLLSKHNNIDIGKFYAWRIDSKTSSALPGRKTTTVWLLDFAVFVNLLKNWDFEEVEGHLYNGITCLKFFSALTSISKLCGQRPVYTETNFSWLNIFFIDLFVI